MKKLAVLLGVIMLSSACLAYIEEDKTSDIDALRQGGFSEGMLHVVDTAKYHHTRGKQERYFLNGPRSGKKLGRGYSSLKGYVDPTQDDGILGEHQVNFSNSWDWGRNRYSARYKATQKPENL